MVKCTWRAKSGQFVPTEIWMHAVASEGRRYVLGLVQDRSEHCQSR